MTKGVRFNRKLEPWMADEIRREYMQAQGRVTYLDLAMRHGVSEGTIARIVTGRSYRGTQTATRVISHEEHMKELGEKLLKVVEEVKHYGPVEGSDLALSPDARAMRSLPASNVRIDPKAARGFYSMFDRWPEGYEPTSDDEQWASSGGSENQ